MTLYVYIYTNIIVKLLCFYRFQMSKWSQLAKPLSFLIPQVERANEQRLAEQKRRPGTLDSASPATV